MKSLESKFCTDQYMKVLGSLTKSPKFAQQISYEAHVSITTVYRKLKVLEEKHLVNISGIFISSSKCKIKLYKKSASLEKLLAIGN